MTSLAPFSNAGTDRRYDKSNRRERNPAMTRPTTTHAHPLCPTCQSDLTGREALGRLASHGSRPLASDDLSGFYEETARLIRFLGALAEAAPPAAAAYAVNLG